MCLSEDRIRAIVREEISNLLDAVGTHPRVAVPDYLQADKIEDAFVAIIETVADSKAVEEVNKHEDMVDH